MNVLWWVRCFTVRSKAARSAATRAFDQHGRCIIERNEYQRLMDGIEHEGLSATPRPCVAVFVVQLMQANAQFARIDAMPLDETLDRNSGTARPASAR